MNNLKQFAIVAAAAWAAPAMAASSYSIVALNFENVTVPNNMGDVDPADLLEFYNGGKSSVGTTGPDYNVSFAAGALVYHPILPGFVGTGAYTNTPSGKGAMGFDSAIKTVTLNFADGFNTGFAFYYAASIDTVSVSVFTGVNGTGTELASTTLGATPPYCSPAEQFYCTWKAASLDIAKGTGFSVTFRGLTNQILFDNVTFGDTVPHSDSVLLPPPVPEPSTYALLALGLGLVVATARKKRKAG
jgi:PEP-CTERM motif